MGLFVGEGSIFIRSRCCFLPRAMLGSQAKRVNVGCKSPVGNRLQGCGVSPAPLFPWGLGEIGQHGRHRHGLLSIPLPCALQKSNSEYGFRQPLASPGLFGAVPGSIATVPRLMAPAGRVGSIAELMGPFWTDFLLGFLWRWRTRCAGQGCSPDVLFHHQAVFKNICDFFFSPSLSLSAYRGETFGRESRGEGGRTFPQICHFSTNDDFPESAELGALQHRGAGEWSWAPAGPRDPVPSLEALETHGSLAASFGYGGGSHRGLALPKPLQVPEDSERARAAKFKGRSGGRAELHLAKYRECCSTIPCSAPPSLW